jgi:hypothetical protein
MAVRAGSVRGGDAGTGVPRFTYRFIDFTKSSSALVIPQCLVRTGVTGHWELEVKILTSSRMPTTHLPSDVSLLRAGGLTASCREHWNQIAFLSNQPFWFRRNRNDPDAYLTDRRRSAGRFRAKLSLSFRVFRSAIY